MIFEPFPKVPRLRRDCTITEKIDGTNAQVAIEEGPPEGTSVMWLQARGDNHVALTGNLVLYAGSRNRWLDTSPKGDNFGFAKWVKEHAEELAKLGPGRHFGEWYGQGIQRGYGLTEKRFALFNTDRWDCAVDRPECCGVVPVLYRGPFDDTAVEHALQELRREGSRAVPFMNPEGIIVWMHASRTMHKVTLEKDEAPKGEQRGG